MKNKPNLKNSFVLKQFFKEEQYYPKFITMDEKDLTNWLEAACGEGDLELVRYLLISDQLSIRPSVHGMYKNTQNGFSDLPLQRAISGEHLQVVRYLLASEELKEHANINDDKILMLGLTAKHKSTDILDFLINDKSLKENLKLFPNCLTVLCQKNANLENIQYLVNTNKTDIAFYSDALKVSVLNNNLEIVKYFYSIFTRQSFFDNWDGTLIFAVRSKNSEVLNFLLQETEMKQYFERDDKNYFIKSIAYSGFINTIKVLLFDYDFKDKQHMINLLYEHANDEILIQTLMQEWNLPYTDNIEKLKEKNIDLYNLLGKKKLQEKMHKEMPTKDKISKYNKSKI